MVGGVGDGSEELVFLVFFDFNVKGCAKYSTLVDDAVFCGSGSLGSGDAFYFEVVWAIERDTGLASAD